MKKELLYGVGGLLIGAVLASAVTVGIANNDQSVEDTTQTSMTMDDMVHSLNGKTGDAFDSAFIAGMIEHHQGAIDMAKRAQENAKHKEIKDMADDIIMAQSKEIDMMQIWQTDWSYKTTPQSHNMHDK